MSATITIVSKVSSVSSLLSCLRKQNILTRHREELHLTASLIRNHAPCNSVAIYICLYTLLIPLRSIVTVETIVTAEMVAINNRPRRRNGHNGHEGLNKLTTSCVPLLGVTCLFILHQLLRVSLQNPDREHIEAAFIQLSEHGFIPEE